MVIPATRRWKGLLFLLPAQLGIAKEPTVQPRTTYAVSGNETNKITDAFFVQPLPTRRLAVVGAAFVEQPGVFFSRLAAFFTFPAHT